MRSDPTTLRETLRDADPAAGTAPYDDDRRREIVAGLLRGTGEPGTVPRRRRDHLRRPVGAAVAATLAVGSAVVAGAVLQTGSAVAAEMSRLAVAAAGPPPAHEYLYTEVRQTYVGGVASRPYATERRWDTETIRSWQGDTCNDRTDETLAPARFFSKQDEEAARKGADEDDLDTIENGYTATVRGEDNRGLDSIPCDRMGTFLHPNPRYAATYPSDADGFLAKATRDVQASEFDNTPADGVLQMLALPYLTQAQRSAALQAFGKAAGEWKVVGHTTVAGIPGVVIRSGGGPVEEERVIGNRAPGLLRSLTRITDPEHAYEIDSRWAGLPKGTVVRDEVLLKVGVTPDLETTP
jgi:hypothetical protein